MRISFRPPFYLSSVVLVLFCIGFITIYRNVPEPDFTKRSPEKLISRSSPDGKKEKIPFLFFADSLRSSIPEGSYARGQKVERLEKEERAALNRMLSGILAKSARDLGLEVIIRSKLSGNPALEEAEQMLRSALKPALHRHKKLILGGSGSGALIALDVAGRHRSSIQALVLLDPNVEFSDASLQLLRAPFIGGMLYSLSQFIRSPSSMNPSNVVADAGTNANANANANAYAGDFSRTASLEKMRDAVMLQSRIRSIRPELRFGQPVLMLYRYGGDRSVLSARNRSLYSVQDMLRLYADFGRRTSRSPLNRAIALRMRQNDRTYGGKNGRTRAASEISQFLRSTFLRGN